MSWLIKNSLISWEAAALRLIKRGDKNSHKERKEIKEKSRPLIPRIFL
jgi:hypothetical protein